MRPASFLLILCAALVAAPPVMAVEAQVPAQTVDTAEVPKIKVPDQVEAAFRYGDFDELERLYAIYGKPGVRSPLTGTARLRHFWMGIDEIGDSTLKVTEAYFTQLDALTRKWSVDHPQSVLAQLLYVESLRSHGWFIRGSGYANTVSPQSWAGLRKYLDLALEHLKRTEALATEDSSWNVQMLATGNALGWNTDRLLPIFENGMAKNPYDDDLYSTMLSTLLPKWGGDYDLVDRFIVSVTQKTREKRGLEMYARLYAAVSHSEAKQSLFSATHASWPKMKQGFDDMLSRYSHTDNRNTYAYFACMAQDRQTLREQLQLMGDAFDRIFWGDNPERRFEECKAMAQQL